MKFVEKYGTGRTDKKIEELIISPFVEICGKIIYNNFINRFLP